LGKCVFLGDVVLPLVAFVLSIVYHDPRMKEGFFMPDLTKEIAAYNEMQQELEAKYTGKWVLIHNQKLVSAFDSFEKAAEEAVRLFGAGPYLIRQVGAPPIVLPASVLYRMVRG